MFQKLIARILSHWTKNKSELIDVSAKANFDVEVSLLSDPGCCRDLNEDCIMYFQRGDVDLLARKGRLAVVADGMGGHSAGEVASRLAVDVIGQAYYEDSNPPPVALVNAFNRANELIYQNASEDSAHQGMGTTCTALVLKDNSAHWAHVGDSRLYLVRQDTIALQTEDHSVVTEMVKSGLINAEEARNHPQKNIILRALGTSSKVNISVTEKAFPIEAGDIFILCSDGLSDLVEDEEIKQHAMAEDLHSACDSLVALAKERGGYDNISVGLLRIKAIDNGTLRIPPETLPG